MVDVELSCRARKVTDVLAVLESRAAAEGATLLRNRPGQNQRKVVIRFPRPADGGAPPTGVREPRNPAPQAPAAARALDEPGATSASDAAR